MSWFRKKEKYWYFVEKIDGKEKQHYIGDDQAVLQKLLPSSSKESIKETKITSRRQIKPAATRPSPDIRTAKLPKKYFIIDLEIERCSPGCHAYDMGSRYLYSHNSKTPTGAMGVGGGGPAKNKEDIISSIKKCIQSKEKFYNAKSRIGKLINKTSLNFSKEDFALPNKKLKDPLLIKKSKKTLVGEKERAAAPGPDHEDLLTA